MAKTNNKKSGGMMSDKSAAVVADAIVRILDGAKADGWTKPWFTPMASAVNIGTPTKPYRGLNAAFLAICAAGKDYKTGFYLTLYKAKEMGMDMFWGKRKDGDVDLGACIVCNYSDGTQKLVDPVPVCYTETRYHDVENDKWYGYRDIKKMLAEGTLTIEQVEMFRQRKLRKWYEVINIDDTTMERELPDVYDKLCKKWKQMQEHETPIREDVYDEALEMLLDVEGAWRCPIYHDGGDQAFYRPSTDDVHLPDRKVFFSVSAYYGTALHELAHSTKGDDKMKRDFGKQHWGDQGYAMEELVAEFTAAFVLNDRGICKTIDKEHIAYVQNWREAIKKKDFVNEIVEHIIKCCQYELRALSEMDKMLAGEIVEAA